MAAWMLTTMAFQDGRLKGLAWVGVLSILAFKSIFEAVTGQLMLPTSAPAGVAVVGVTHVIGLAVGILAAMAGRHMPCAWVCAAGETRAGSATARSLAWS